MGRGKPKKLPTKNPRHETKPGKAPGQHPKGAPPAKGNPGQKV